MPSGPTNNGRALAATCLAELARATRRAQRPPPRPWDTLDVVSFAEPQPPPQSPRFGVMFEALKFIDRFTRVCRDASDNYPFVIGDTAFFYLLEDAEGSAATGRCIAWERDTPEGRVGLFHDNGFNLAVVIRIESGRKFPDTDAGYLRDLAYRVRGDRARLLAERRDRQALSSLASDDDLYRVLANSAWPSSSVVPTQYYYQGVPIAMGTASTGTIGGVARG